MTWGVWIDENYRAGFEGTYFFLGEKSFRFNVASSGEPGSLLLARPYIDAAIGQETSRLVAVPGLMRGAVNVFAPTDFQDAEGTGVYTVYRTCPLCVDLLGGFRYLELGDKLRVTDSETVLPGVPVIGGISTVAVDTFRTRDHFYGGQAGARVTWRRGRFVATALTKLALGEDVEVSHIGGATLVPIPGLPFPLTFPGGLLGQPSNSGRRENHEFAVVPEVGLDVGWQLNENIRLFSGYTFLYESAVLRPANLVDLVVNPLQGPPGPARPAFFARQTDFWAMGLTGGIEIRY
jgi:hypothetical protein